MKLEPLTGKSWPHEKLAAWEKKQEMNQADREVLMLASAIVGLALLVVCGVLGAMVQ